MTTHKRNRIALLGATVALAIAFAASAAIQAQPPGAGEFQTVRGTVKDFTTAPMGEVDGLVLSDGTWVHWPPHMEGRFKGAVARGDDIRVTGRRETDPKGYSKLEVSSLANLSSNVTIANPDLPMPATGALASGGPRSIEERLQALEEKVDRLMADIQRLLKK
jgi:hypothetical protein